MAIQYSAWPFAVRSFGFYAPEMVVQVPMQVFTRLMNEATEDRRPDWGQSALNSGQDHVLMQARTFYGLVGDDLPQWILDLPLGGESEDQHG